MTSATGGQPTARFPEVISFPPDTLARHRARMLEPPTALRAPDGSWPLTTAYRADSLMIPATDARRLLSEEDNEYVEPLRQLGLRLRPAADEGWRENLRVVHDDLPVPFQLVTRDDAVGPGATDPWSALVRLRQAFGTEPGRRVGLNHLVAAASVTVEGAPVNHGGQVEGNPVNHGGGMGQSRIALYTGSRNPVAMLGRRPVRAPAGDLVSLRRPVVAVLDTGIGPHPWLPIGPIGADPVVEISDAFQLALAAHEPWLTPHPLVGTA
ncbi:MAG TPA: hypothetical protein VH969_18075, partial [Actinophytocola sp.]